MILAYKKLQNKKEKLIQEKEVIKQKNISKSKSKSKPKFKSKSKSKSKSTSFQHYFQECIKDKVIPEDAPEYIKKALLKAKKEYEKGIILEKSTLYFFAEKYDIKGSPGLIPIEFFREKASIIKDFLRNYQNTKVRMILVCLMEKKEIIQDPSGKSLIYITDKAYFHSRTHINLEKTDVKLEKTDVKLEKTDVKLILKDMIKEMLANLINYQKKGSDWYFKEVIRLEIHIVDYKPMKGGSWISLPEFIQKKMQ